MKNHNYQERRMRRYAGGPGMHIAFGIYMNVDNGCYFVFTPEYTVTESFFMRGYGLCVCEVRREFIECRSSNR
jgi:hypothetical protein